MDHVCLQEEPRAFVSPVTEKGHQKDTLLSPRVQHGENDQGVNEIFRIEIPVQLNPLPPYPSLQEQLYQPMVL